jgi:methylase of polypeptide subunit release factors
MSRHLQNSPHFKLLRNYLQAAGFNEKSICGRLGITELRDLLSNRRKGANPPKESDELNLLTRLLLLGESFQREELESVLTSRVVEALTSLGLASLDLADGSRLFCPVVLYPVGSVFIVSDRCIAQDGKDFKVSDDFVYPAITPNTTEFLATLPVTPCDSFLELCSGTGAVALAASGYAKKSWAIDIAERSTQMAEFNRLLNGLDNVTVLKGNLYEGVEDLKFDRIVAHPPYMPVLRPAQIFYDGGADGEQITRRIVEALPHFLKPGGCFYCLAQGSDRKGAPLEERVRGWLGEGQTDFDVAVVEKRGQDPKEAAFIYALKSKGGFETVDLMRDSLSSLGVESMVYGWIIIQRKNDTRKVFTVRRSAGRRTGREEIAWLLKWETFAAGPSAFEDLQGMIPVARRSLDLRTIHRMKEGELLPEQLALHTEDPFAMNCQVDPWVAFLIPLCDGQATVRQLWERCKAHNFIHAETPPQEFAKLIGVLISGGFLEVADFCPPNPQAGEKPLADAHDHLQHQAL